MTQEQSLPNFLTPPTIALLQVTCNPLQTIPKSLSYLKAPMGPPASALALAFASALALALAWAWEAAGGLQLRLRL